MSTFDATYDGPDLATETIARDRARELLGRVMGLVTVTVGFAALGAYLGRDLSGATGLLLLIGAFAVIFGLNAAAARGPEQLPQHPRRRRADRGRDLPRRLQRLPAGPGPVRRPARLSLSTNHTKESP